MEQYSDIYRWAMAKYSRVATAPSDTVGGSVQLLVFRLTRGRIPDECFFSSV